MLPRFESSRTSSRFTSRDLGGVWGRALLDASWREPSPPVVGATLDKRRRSVQSRAARVCSQSLTIGCERPRKLLTNHHFSPRGGQIGRRRRFFLYEAETLANAGFDASIRLLQERSPSPRCARFCNLLTNPHHAPQPALLLGFGRIAGLKHSLPVCSG